MNDYNEFLMYNVKRLAETFTESYGKFPEFEDLIRECIYLKGLGTSDYLFSSLKEGWLLNGFMELDFNSLHTKIFKYDLLYYYDELIEELKEREIPMSSSLSDEEVKELNDEIIRDAGGYTEEDLLWDRLETFYQYDKKLTAIIQMKNEKEFIAELLVPIDFGTAEEAFLIKSNATFIKNDFNKNLNYFISYQKDRRIEVRIISLDRSKDEVIIKPTYNERKNN